MPGPNLKNSCNKHQSIFAPAWFLLHFLIGERNPVKRHSTRCLLFTYQTVKLIRDQSTLRSSIYWSSNLENLSANHTRYNLTIGHNLDGILRDDSHFPERQKLRTLTTKIKDWKKHSQTLKSYFTFSLKHEQKMQPGLRSQQWIKSK